MAIFIGHISALEYWASHDREPWHAPTQATPRPGDTPSPQDAATALHHHGIGSPLHAFVARAEDRRNAKTIKFHVVQNVPRRSFVKLENNVYLSTPETCFLQLANSLSFEDLVLVGLELCGFYGTIRTHEAGNRGKTSTMETRKPRMTPRSLSTYLQRAGRNHGIAKATKAARHIVAGSASPMESALVSLLCLPNTYGGYSLPRPLLNHEVKLSKRSKLKLPTTMTGVLRPDLCWPKEKLVIEYDSDLFHSGVEKLNRDSRRRAILELEGYHVISVTKKQLYGEIAFDEIAKTVARYLDCRIRIRTKDFESRQRTLRKKALGID